MVVVCESKAAIGDVKKRLCAIGSGDAVVGCGWRPVTALSLERRVYGRQKMEKRSSR